MTPTEAANKLRDAGWSDGEIAHALDVNLTTVFRIRKGGSCEYTLGVRLVELAKKPGKKRAA